MNLILKPANVLVAFDRSGKARDFKAKYFKQAQLKLTDFGVSRVFTRTDSESNQTTTATVSVEYLNKQTGIAGTQAYMHPDVLELIDKIKTGKLTKNPDVDSVLLIKSDTFAVGCVIAYLCSDGLHPYQHHQFDDIPAQIRGHRRVRLQNLSICNKHHEELVDRFTTHKGTHAWTVAEGLARSPIFDQHGGGTQAEILLDRLAMFERPKHSCEMELLEPRVVDMCPCIPSLMANICTAAARLQANAAQLPAPLDLDS